MNIKELKSLLQGFVVNKDSIGVSIYALLTGKEHPDPQKLDIDESAESSLRELFLHSIEETILNKDELSLIKLSSSDERNNSIYLYDIDVPEELKSMEKIVATDDVPKLDLNFSKLTTINALLIEIGNDEDQVVLYKTMAPINIFSRKNLFIKKAKNRLIKIDDEFLRISPGFQLLLINKQIVVIDLEAIEKSFGFHEIIKKEAKIGLDSIDSMKLIENVEVLHELIDDVKYARRFTKIAKSSPVIKAGVSNKNIIDFCSNFPNLSGKIRFNNKKTKIILDTKTSKDLFIKLLMDDFLTSELTKYHYSSVAKDPIDNSEEDN